MARNPMQQQVAEEMERITKGGKGSPQQKLRFTYTVFRQHDLAGASPPRGDTLRRAVEFVLESYPGAELRYDRDYFGV